DHGRNVEHHAQHPGRTRPRAPARAALSVGTAAHGLQDFEKAGTGRSRPSSARGDGDRPSVPSGITHPTHPAGARNRMNKTKTFVAAVALPAALLAMAVQSASAASAPTTTAPGATVPAGYVPLVDDTNH